jgi:hypothetical protein
MRERQSKKYNDVLHVDEFENRGAVSEDDYLLDASNAK